MSQRYDDFGDIAVDPITGLHRLGANGPSLSTAIAVAGATKRRIALLHETDASHHAVRERPGQAPT